MDSAEKSFAIKDHVTIDQGRGDLRRVTLRMDGENSAEVYLNGAHITSWIHGGRQRLFMSELSRFSNGQPIRGGIPLVFPQFGPGELPQHGFARNLTWTVDATGMAGDGTVTLRLVLEDGAESRKLWDHPFALSFTVDLGRALRMTLRVENPGSAPFRFTSALHTYFAVSDIRHTRVEGLEGTGYVDNLKDRARRTDNASSVRFETRTGRTYFDTRPELSVVDETEGWRTTMSKVGYPDAVVWNPGIEQSRTMDDFGNEEYKRMVCVEAARVAEPVRLEPSESWEGGQTLSVSRAD